LDVLTYTGIVLAVIIVALIVESLIVALYPCVSVKKQHLAQKPPREETASLLIGNREEMRFDIKGNSLSARLYLPESASFPVPCIVMAHGLGGTRDMALESYAVRFQKEGMAVLVFDYRHFGASEGQPRQRIDISRQLQDYAAAIAYARSLKEIDAERIALWGTSLSGGHVLVTAARDSKIACICAQCPLLNGAHTSRAHVRHRGIKYMLQMIGHGQRDMVRSWIGLSPHKIPLVGKPGTIALMASMDAWNAFSRMAPEGFVNEACARIAIQLYKYKPLNQLGRINCPVLIQAGDNDAEIPCRDVNRAEKLLGRRGEVMRYPIGHFDFYFGDNFEKAVNDQIAFFKKYLTR
jgi:uncharacterized protein